MIRPPAWKIKCTECNYTKTHRPKSDALIGNDLPPSVCPKCGGDVKMVSLDFIDKIFSEFL